MARDHKKLLEKEALEFEKTFGRGAAQLGSEHIGFDVCPTGILTLDYTLGTMGLPFRHMVEIFGAHDIGKNTVFGFNAIKNAQKMGKLCGLVAIEPHFDESWAERHGVDLDMLLIGRPKTGEEAFAMLHKWLRGDVIDVIVFDSIGALLHESELEEDGKAKSGGQAGLITWGVKAAAPLCWRNNKLVVYLNQQRQERNSPIPNQFESPGGEALRHMCPIRIHVKKSGPALKAKVPGEGDQPIEIGRTITAVIKRNKCAEGSMKKAEFDYYIMETEDHPLGVDVAGDLVSIGLRTGVFEKNGAWYSHPTFPGGKLQGKPAIDTFIRANPEAMETIREDVMKVMIERQGAPKMVKPKLEAINAE